MRRSSRAEVPRLKNSRTKIEAVGGGGEEKGSLGVWVLGLNCPLSSVHCLPFEPWRSRVLCSGSWVLGFYYRLVTSVGTVLHVWVEAAWPELRRREGRGWQASLIRGAFLKFSLPPERYRSGIPASPAR